MQNTTISTGEWDIVLWANIAAGSALLFYALIGYLQVRGLFIPSPRMLKYIRFCCLCLLLTPIAARYHYSHDVIIYLSAAMIMLGVLIKLKKKLGI